MESFLFYFIAAVSIGSGILFMSSKKIVHSVFYCFILFIALSGVFLLLDAPFIAAAQIFIYGGAVTVLILFVVMVTTTDIYGNLKNYHSTLGVFVSIFFATLIVFAIQATKWPVAKKVVANTGGALQDLTNKLAEQLFKIYYFPFEIAGILLLAALIGAIYLAREKE